MTITEMAMEAGLGEAHMELILIHMRKHAEAGVPESQLVNEALGSVHAMLTEIAEGKTAFARRAREIAFADFQASISESGAL